MKKNAEKLPKELFHSDGIFGKCDCNTEKLQPMQNKFMTIVLIKFEPQSFNIF